MKCTNYSSWKTRAVRRLPLATAAGLCLFSLSCACGVLGGGEGRLSAPSTLTSRSQLNDNQGQEGSGEREGYEGTDGEESEEGNLQKEISSLVM